ncbi:MAG: hypothetical protein ACRD0P_06315 [Stackebrandtia sp.]
MTTTTRFKRHDRTGKNGKTWHYYMLDGKRADGVTTLISGGLPKPALLRWAPKMVAAYVADNPGAVNALWSGNRDQMVRELKEVPWSQRDAAAAKGTEVHALAERLSRGEEIEVPEALEGYVNSAVAFLDEWRVRPLQTEVAVANRQWGYAGTADVLAELGGRTVLMDYKTSRSGIYGETALQLAAYSRAEVYLDADDHEQPMPTIDAAYAVWLRPDGYNVYAMDISESVYKAYLHVAYVARQAKQLDSWISDALELPHV